MLYMFAILLEFRDQTKGSKLKATRAAWLKKRFRPQFWLLSCHARRGLAAKGGMKNITRRLSHLQGLYK